VQSNRKSNVWNNYIYCNGGINMNKISIILIFVIVVLSFICIDVIWNSTYIKGVHDCTDMSRELEDILEILGFDVIICHGYPDNNASTIGHVWIKIGSIQIEATNLCICNNHDIYNVHYKEYNDYDDNKPSYYEVYLQ